MQSFIVQGLNRATSSSSVDKNLFLTLTFVLFAVRGSRPGKNVQLTENEIRGLCLKSREIFLSQPILLELEAPLKICGELIGFVLVDPPVMGLIGALSLVLDPAE